MLSENFSFQSGDGTNVFVYKWSPDSGTEIKGAVQIAHGMAETAFRYERFADLLTQNGYAVYANDHRGHGRTAGSLENVGYLAEADGFDWLVEDMHQLTTIIKKEHSNLPIFLFGHSMGSFATQRYIMLFGKELKGVILSGSSGRAVFLHNFGFLAASREVKKNGRREKSENMNRLSFGSFNNAFKPNRTEFDWLSADKDEVDKYIKDPYCGGVFSAGFFYDFMKGLRETDRAKDIVLIPKKLPIYIFSGDKDPVGDAGKGVRKLYNTYKKAGIRDVTLKLYPGGRHEMLNEINKDEVMKDVIEWLKSK